MTRTSLAIAIGLAAAAASLLAQNPQPANPPQDRRRATRSRRDTCGRPSCRTARCRRQTRRQLHHRPDAQRRAGDGVQDGVPQGTVHTFTMSSADSKLYPGIARDSGTFGDAGSRKTRRSWS